MPIPLKLREKMASDGSMLHCIHRNADCSGRVEWEHSFLYQGKKIQEEWAIVPCCYMHHRGGKIDKDYNRYRSLLKAIDIYGSLDDIIKRYPKKDWLQEWKFLKSKYTFLCPTKTRR